MHTPFTILYDCVILYYISILVKCQIVGECSECDVVHTLTNSVVYHPTLRIVNNTVVNPHLY